MKRYVSVTSSSSQDNYNSNQITNSFRRLVKKGYDERTIEECLAILYSYFNWPNREAFGIKDRRNGWQ